MEDNPLARVRADAEFVAARARHVRIDVDRLVAYAAAWSAEDVREEGLDPAHHYVGHGDATLAYVVALDAVNFGSGYFPHLAKSEGLSGYMTIASRLTRHFEQRGAPSAAELATVDGGWCSEVFAQPRDGADRDALMQLYATSLNQLGSFLLERFDGSVAALAGAAGHSAARLVRLLCQMPWYRDVADYHGRSIAFYKRAQITPSDLAHAFAGDGPGAFSDIEQLTAFADNVVPHVLRVDGVLVYDAVLAARIDEGRFIEASSEEEIELRACAVHAVELLVIELRRRGLGASSRDIDNALWNRGHAEPYRRTRRHRTRTVFY